MKARFKKQFLKKYLLSSRTLLTRQTQFYMAHHIHSFQQIKLITVLTLLGLGLIKINDVSANFNKPRPSLILNN